MPDDFRVIAIVAAYNEEDIIASAIEALIVQGVQVYLIDHRSTDHTVREASRLLGKGLLHIERFPDESGFPPEDAAQFALGHQLERKATLARELHADWFLHLDADEFRESPWRHLNLVEAIRLVDRLGYNAIDFEVLNFWPTGEILEPGDDVRETFQWYEPVEPWNKRQIKGWKRTAEIDLASSGGHEAEFSNRSVFPLRFLLRHYPIRGQAHGERKVFEERRGRFPEAEQARGWHVQYDGIEHGHIFTRDRATLLKYDPDLARLAMFLRNRRVDELERELQTQKWELEDRTRVLADRVKDAAVLSAQSAERMDTVLALRRHVDELNRTIDEHACTIASLQAELHTLKTTLETTYASKSWRYTALLRGAGRALRGSRSGR